MFKKIFNKVLSQSFISEQDGPLKCIFTEEKEDYASKKNSKIQYKITNKNVHLDISKATSSVSNASFELEELKAEFKFNIQLNSQSDSKSVFSNISKENKENCENNDLSYDLKCSDAQVSSKKELNTPEKLIIDRPLYERFHDDHFLSENGSFYPNFSAESSHNVSMVDLCYACS